jgi:hypothetical protein
MEGEVQEVRAKGAGLVQLRFQRVAPPQQFLLPRHDPLLFGQPAPTGLSRPAQGWRAATTLGRRIKNRINPEGVASVWGTDDATPLGLKTI